MPQSVNGGGFKLNQFNSAALYFPLLILHFHSLLTRSCANVTRYPLVPGTTPRHNSTRVTKASTLQNGYDQNAQPLSVAIESIE